MNEDFAKLAYEEHRQLFLHYSSLVFRARVAMATLIVGVFVFLRGSPAEDVLFGLPALAVLPYLAAVLVPVLFAMETAYLTRLVEVAHAAGRIEREFETPLYFAAYARPRRLWLYLLYVLATLALLTVFVCHSRDILGFEWALILTLFPLAVLIRVIPRVP